MSDFRISTRSGKTQFRPGDIVEGSASWNLLEAPKSVEIRLLWFTRGKGTPDASIVESSQVASPGAMSDAPFRFTLPEGPHSFSGQLVAVAWAVEIVVQPMKGRERPSERLEISLSTGEGTILLPKIEQSDSSLQTKWKKRLENYRR